MLPRTFLFARSPACLRLGPSTSAGPSSAAATLLSRHASSSSSSSSSKPASEPFHPRQSAAEEAARAQALRQKALDRMGRLKLEELERTKRAAASTSRPASSSTARASAGQARPTDEPDRPHPTVERLRRERERKRLAAEQAAQAELLHEAPADKGSWQTIVDWYWAMTALDRLKAGGVLFLLATVGLLFFDDASGPSTEQAYAQDTDWMRAELIRLETEEKERRMLERAASRGGGRMA